MKLIAINAEITSSQKTVFLRRLERILIENKFMTDYQLKEFRGFAASGIVQELGFLSEELQESSITCI
jgi:hypothetical protein